MTKSSSEIQPKTPERLEHHAVGRIITKWCAGHKIERGKRATDSESPHPPQPFTVIILRLAAGETRLSILKPNPAHPYLLLFLGERASMLAQPTRPLRQPAIALVLLLSVQFLGSGHAATAGPPIAPATFAQPEFQRLWATSDEPVATGVAARSWLWGPAPGVSVSEPYAQGVDGKRAVQYFDKARMELNTVVTDTTSPWRVTTGLLVNEMVEGRIQTGDRQFVALGPSTQPVFGDESAANLRYADFTKLLPVRATDRTGAAVTEVLGTGGLLTTARATGPQNSHYVSETGHNIPDVFWNYMNQTGAVQNSTGKVVQARLFDWAYTMGFPITEAYWTTMRLAGKDHAAIVQLFQRRSLTYVPDFPQGWQVQMGNVGQHYYSWRYGPQAPTAAPGQPTATRTPVSQALQPASGGFVGISGSKFIYASQEVKLKGTNYWISTQPFVSTWAEWDGPQVLAELKKAHDMGVNTVRIGLPFNHSATRDVVWDDDASMAHVSGWIINQMTQLLQVASIYGMKVIFTLFEWYDEYPAEGSRAERTNIAYIEGLVGAFSNDDRVLAWDLHNEPDAYGEWQGGHQDSVIKWLQRMYGYVRHLDTRHPVTVGVARSSSLLYPANDGTTILSFVDFAAFHSYDAGAITVQISELKAHTQKPLLLEEMGWPTAIGAEPPPDNAVFDESTQSYLYKNMLDAARQQDIGGVVQWTLYDFPPKSTSGGRTASYEENFGLVRLDGSLKPAAAIFSQGYTARDLPSDKKTYEGLTPAGKRNKP